MPDTTIDLSAGLVPKQNETTQPIQPTQSVQANAPNTPTSIDLSAGLVPKVAPTDNGSTVPPTPESTLSKAGTMAEDVGAGIVKGAGQTVNTISGLISKVAPSIVRPQDVQTLTQAETPTNLAQKIGVGAEGIAEFFLGDEALKGLSIAERLGMASKVAKLAETNPVIAKIINGGLNVVRTGATSGAQSAAHAPEGERASAAGTGALYGAAGGAVTEAATAGITGLLPKTKQGLLKEAEEALTEQRLTRRQAASAVEEAAAKASDAARGIPQPVGAAEFSPANSEARTFQEASDEIKSHFNETYNALREQSGGILNHETGRFGPNGFDDAVAQIKRAKKVIYSPSPASTDALKQAESELAEGNQKLKDMFGQNDDYKDAQAGWAKASTLEDFHSSIDKAFTEPAGVRDSGITRGSMGEINPKTFVARANKSIDDIGPDKLRNAMGIDAYRDLFTVRTELSNMLDDESYGKNVDRLVRDYMRTRNIPQGSPLRTAGAMLATVLSGAGIGATAGAATARLKNEDVSAGAEQGAITGGVLGSLATVPVGAAHWLYTHPTQAVAVLRAVKVGAQPVAQAVKQLQGRPTHVFNPDTNELEPVPANQ